jgi:hypothetical protein
MYRRRTEQHRQDDEGDPIDRRQSKDEPETPPTEPGFDGQRDAADEEQRRQRRVKAKQQIAHFCSPVTRSRDHRAMPERRASPTAGVPK